MKQKYISIIAQLLVTIMGVVMLFIAQGFEDFAGTNTYIASSYYPSIICILLILFGLWGIIEDVNVIRSENKKGKEAEKFVIGNTFNLLLIIAAAFFVLLAWQLLDLFYPSVLIAVTVLMFFFKPRTTSLIKHIGFSLLVSIVLFTLFYVIFDLLLQVRF